MPRYYSNKKEESDYLKKIDIFHLNKWGYLKPHSHKSGVISWGNDFSNHKDTIGIEVNIDNMWCSFKYTQTQKQKEFHYSVPLTVTYCHFRGTRYWFTCPLIRNGTSCDRRVATLYLAGDYFGCRHCYNLTYQSRNLSRAVRNDIELMIARKLFDAEKVGDKVSTPYYKDKPTKKYIRFQKINDRAWYNASLLYKFKKL